MATRKTPVEVNPRKIIFVLLEGELERKIFSSSGFSLTNKKARLDL